MTKETPEGERPLRAAWIGLLFALAVCTAVVVMVLAPFFSVILLAVVAVVLYVRVQLQTEAGRQLRDRLLLRIPALGRIVQSLAVARFCRVLGTPPPKSYTIPP